MKRLLPALFAAGLFGQIMFAQQVSDTRAKPTDWEEINFEFGQSVLVDGFPSLLRLSDLLKQHPDYKVTLVGNTDQIGSNRANDALSLRRANTVAQFLQKYGAAANQIQVRGDGKKNLAESGRGVNPRFINRRVVVTVTAPDGTVIGDGSMTSAINEFIQYARGQLGKLDGIVSQLQDLTNQVRALQGDTGAIRQDTGAIRQDTGAIRTTTTAIHGDTQELVRRPPPLTAEQTTEIARAEATRAADYALTQSALRNRKYSLVGADIGPTFGSGRMGIYSADLFGKALIPFGNGQTPDQPGTHGVQVDGDWVYFHKRARLRDSLSDGMFDIGLVNRFNRLQVGTFAQFDYVTFAGYQGGGLLGAGVVTVDFVFHGGSIGVFGAKGFRSYANIGTTSLGSSAITPAYIRYDDQVGVHAAGAFGEHMVVEGSVAFKKRYAANASKLPASELKVTFPVQDRFAFFIEGDQNTTFQNFNNGYRLVFGFQFGRWVRPREYGTGTGVVPVSVPRAHYELLAR